VPLIPVPPPSPPGPAWFRHRLHANQPIRVYLRGAFHPICGYVTDVTGPNVEITPLGKQPIVIKASGPHNVVASAEVFQ